MQFCPKCGGVMMPVGRQDGKVVLRCMRCGHQMVVDASQVRRHYTIGSRVPSEERVVTTSRVSEGRGMRRDQEEWEQEREEYREVLLEQLQEELEGVE